jgi:hypothetical protein
MTDEEILAGARVAMKWRKVVADRDARIEELEQERDRLREALIRIAVEEKAKQIYERMPYDGLQGTKPAWVEYGNSDKQDEARRQARAALDGGK